MAAIFPSSPQDSGSRSKIRASGDHEAKVQSVAGTVALADGVVDEDRLRDLLAGQLPADVPLMFGVDATTYPRPNVECSPDRGLHYAPCRCDGDRKVVPGWQFQ